MARGKSMGIRKKVKDKRESTNSGKARVHLERQWGPEFALRASKHRPMWGRDSTIQDIYVAKYKKAEEVGIVGTRTS